MTGREKPAIQTRFGLMRLTRLLGMNEVRSPPIANQSESEAKPARSEKHCRCQGRMGWLETECPEVHVRESRIPVLALKGAGQESESS